MAKGPHRAALQIADLEEESICSSIDLVTALRPSAILIEDLPGLGGNYHDFGNPLEHWMQLVFRLVTDTDGESFYKIGKSLR